MLVVSETLTGPLSPRATINILSHLATGLQASPGPHNHLHTDLSVIHSQVRHLPQPLITNTGSRIVYLPGYISHRPLPSDLSQGGVILESTRSLGHCLANCTSPRPHLMSVWQSVE